LPTVSEVFVRPEMPLETSVTPKTPRLARLGQKLKGLSSRFKPGSLTSARAVTSANVLDRLTDEQREQAKLRIRKMEAVH